jgi:predicted dehydrogenase
VILWILNRSKFLLVDSLSSISPLCSYDRFSPALKGTWKDNPLPGNGIVFDLGAHLIDQALQLFGRPSKITAFMDHVRGLGEGALEDRVSGVMW